MGAPDQTAWAATPSGGNGWPPADAWTSATDVRSARRRHPLGAGGIGGTGGTVSARPTRRPPGGKGGGRRHRRCRRRAGILSALAALAAPAERSRRARPGGHPAAKEAVGRVRAGRDTIAPDWFRGRVYRRLRRAQGGPASRSGLPNIPVRARSSRSRHDRAGLVPRPGVPAAAPCPGWARQPFAVPAVSTDPRSTSTHSPGTFAELQSGSKDPSGACPVAAPRQVPSPQCQRIRGPPLPTRPAPSPNFSRARRTRRARA